jgi:hypothetical protein
LLDGQRADDAVQELAQTRRRAPRGDRRPGRAAAELTDSPAFATTQVLTRIYRNPFRYTSTSIPRLLGGLSVPVGDEDRRDAGLRLAAAETKLPDWSPINKPRISSTSHEEGRKTEVHGRV